MFDDIVPIEGTSIAHLRLFTDYCGQCARTNKDLYKGSKFDDSYYLLCNLGIGIHLYRHLKLMLIQVKL